MARKITQTTRTTTKMHAVEAARQALYHLARRRDDHCAKFYAESIKLEQMTESELWLLARIVSGKNSTGREIIDFIDKTCEEVTR